MLIFSILLYHRIIVIVLIFKQIIRFYRDSKGTGDQSEDYFFSSVLCKYVIL